MSSSSAFSRSYKIRNKIKRQEVNLKEKKAKENEKRTQRFQRKREEDKDPRLREERQSKNKPMTIEAKRVWDSAFGDEGDALGLAVDVEKIKRQKTQDEAIGGEEEEGAEVQSLSSEDGDLSEADDDADSMLDSEESAAEDGDASAAQTRSRRKKAQEEKDTRRRETSPAPSTTATNMDLTPEFLQAKFPSLFEPPSEPKILLTTSINSNLHNEAELLALYFPNTTYIRRSAHRFGHKYSIKEISGFAANRGYSAVLVLNEDQKKPSGLDIVHLPKGPMFHFSISNWIEGKKIPGHGNPTNHYPELILNNFRTPLGLLTAHLFRTMFPPQPEFVGRQVVTFHNQRDYIFCRMHRYVFRDKRATEKSVIGTDGKPVKGVEEIRAGLQEVGARFTLKLRRVDRGIQRASGQEWEWKGKQDKARTRFQL